MITWLVPRQDLTPDQARVVEMPPDLNRVVLGMAGSGKTQVLVHRAAFLAERYKVPPERFRIFVFTNVIKEYIRSGLETLRLPESAVSTFDCWCVDTYERHISSRLPRTSSGRYGQNVDFPAIRCGVLGLVRRHRKLQKAFDFVLVDEGQDLGREVYEIIYEIARHVTVFADPQQKIFEDGTEAGLIFDSLRITGPQAAILGGFRNAAYVAELAAHFVEDPLKRRQYLAQVNAAQKIKERPLLFIADSYEQEMALLAEVIRSRQTLNERVGIIVPTNKLLYGLAEGLAASGVTVETAAARMRGRKVEVACSFANLVPKIATFFQAKGLTFDSVILPRLTGSAFYGLSAARIKPMMFVGIARATQWACLSTITGQEFQAMDTLLEAAAEGHVILQRGRDRLRSNDPRLRDAPAPTADGPAGKTGASDDDEFSIL